MRTRSLFIVILILGVFAISCDDSGSNSTFNSSNSNNVNNSECTPGEIVCDFLTARICSATGQWSEEQCDINCIHGTGCTGCDQGETFCDGDDVMVCDDNNTLQYQETCTESVACVFGECVNRCDPSLLTTSNVGCEFWAVDLDNEAYDVMGSSNDAAGEQFAVVVANTNDWPINVTVYKNIARFGEPVQEIVSAAQNGTANPTTIPANSLVQIDLPQREVDGTMGQNSTYEKYTGSGTFVSSHGYRIVTDGPAVAYQFNPIIQDYSNDASILLPQQSLGKHHYVMGWPTANPCGNDFMPMESIPDHTSVTIMGTVENTVVTVYPTHPITASGGDSGLTIEETPAGTPVSFTIGPFDVVNLESLALDDMQDCLLSGYDGDFTGTRIESTAPVAIFSSLERGIGFGGADPPLASGYEDGCCTDHLEQQMFPTRALGWDYVISRSPVRSTDSSYVEPDIYRILATEDNTVVTTSLSNFPSFSLNAGEHATFWAQEGFTITTAGGAIMVGQILISQGYIPGGIGDPTFVVFPAVDQHREEYVFLVPTTFEDNYMVLAMPEGAGVHIDGLALQEFQTNCTTSPIGMYEAVNYVQMTCHMTEGAHSVSSDAAVGLTVYGYYNVGSYGYPGGSDINIINPIE